jgi:probable nitrogen fixation protein
VAAMVPDTALTEAALFAQPFMRTLVGLIRAEDSYGHWDRKSDADLVRPFVLTNEGREAVLIGGEPDPETLHRVEQFYRAIGLLIEQRSRLMTSTLMSVGREGAVRLILTVGRLVAHDAKLTDVHRFGFDDLQGLAQEGEAAIAASLVVIDQYQEAARD